MFWILIHAFPSLCLPDNQTKQSWKWLRKCTGSTILYYSMMDVWTGFRTCNVFRHALCYLSQTFFILLLERWNFFGGGFFWFCFCLFFPRCQAQIPLFQFKPIFFTSVRVQSNVFSVSFVSPSLAKKVSSYFPPPHAMCPKALICIGRAEI